MGLGNGHQRNVCGVTAGPVRRRTDPLIDSREPQCYCFRHNNPRGIAEAFGRFHYGEKLNFLYYARGSIFETKYWVNRAGKRALLTQDEQRANAEALTVLAIQINMFARALKSQRSDRRPPSTDDSGALRAYPNIGTDAT
jgi:hypothetical protein